MFMLGITDLFLAGQTPTSIFSTFQVHLFPLRACLSSRRRRSLPLLEELSPIPRSSSSTLHFPDVFLFLLPFLASFSLACKLPLDKSLRCLLLKNRLFFGPTLQHSLYYPFSHFLGLFWAFLSFPTRSEGEYIFSSRVFFWWHHQYPKDNCLLLWALFCLLHPCWLHPFWPLILSLPSYLTRHLFILFLKRESRFSQWKWLWDCRTLPFRKEFWSIFMNLLSTWKLHSRK